MAKRKDAQPADEPVVEQEAIPEQEVQESQSFSEMAAQEVAAEQGDVQVEQEAQPEPVQPSWYERIGLKDVDEDTAIERITSAFNYAHGQQQELQRRQAEYQQALAAKADLEHRYQQLLQAQQAPKPEPEKPSVSRPRYNPDWDEWIDQTSPTGFAEGTPPSVKSEVRKYRQAYTDFQRKLLEDPESILAPVIETRAKQMVEPFQKELEAVREQIAQQQQRSLIESIVGATGGLLVNVDAQGRPIRDPYTGMPQLNENGQQFDQITAILKQAGVNNPQVQIALASELLAARLTNAQRQAQPTNQIATDPKKALIERGRQQGANRIPSRGQTVRVAADSPEVMQNSRISFSQMLAQQIAADNQDT